MPEGSRLDCRTGLHHRPLLAGLPAVCPSAGTRSPDHRTHCTHSMLSMGTWCSQLEVRRGEEGEVRKKDGAKIPASCLLRWVGINLTTVFLIRSIHTVPLQVTSAVQVNALATATRELLGGAGAGRWWALWSHRWSGCGAWEGIQ